jgi:hypothetical protein
MPFVGDGQWGPGRRAERLGRFPRPGPSRTYGVSASGANGRSRQVLYDQRGRLIGVVVTDAEDARSVRRPMAIVSPAFHETPGALRNVGGSAGVPSSSSSLNVSPYAIGLPSVSGWDRTAWCHPTSMGRGLPAACRR